MPLRSVKQVHEDRCPNHCCQPVFFFVKRNPGNATGEFRFSGARAAGAKTEAAMHAVLARGVAIDQHFTQRKRQPDIELVMSRYRQLLGIGLDEGTALVVRGSVAEVVGKNRVTIYDATRPPRNEVLAPGSRYDLNKRRKVE